MIRWAIFFPLSISYLPYFFLKRKPHSLLLGSCLSPGGSHRGRGLSQWTTSGAGGGTVLACTEGKEGKFSHGRICQGSSDNKPGGPFSKISTLGPEPFYLTSCLLQEEGPLWEFVCGLPCLRFWMEGIAGAILDAVQGFRKVHIVDLGAWSGQWPYLIRQLAERPGGPPEEVRFTSVVAPAGDPMGLGPVDRSEAFDGPLRRAAQECSLRLSISRVECPLAHLSFSSFREQGEVGKEGEEEALVINCALRLSQLPDSSVLRCSPRDWVLRQLAEAQPVLVTQAEMEADCNSPFFLERIRNTFDLFWKVFEAHAEFPGLTSLAREKGRELFESAVLGREIRNIIGCEGSLRVVRHQPSASWHSRMAKAGLIPKNIPNNLVKFLRSSANSRVAELDCLISKPGTAALTYGGEVIGTVLTWQPFTRALLAIQG